MLKKLLYILLVTIVTTTVVKAQDYSQYQVKAAIIYRVCKNVYWQPGTLSDTFKVLFYGANQDFFNQLKQLEYFKIHDHPVKVENSYGFFRLSSPAPNVIIVDSKRNDELENIYSTLKDKPVLLITDGAPTMSLTMINLIDNSGNIEIKINNDNLQEHGLLAAPRLLILGGKLEEVRTLYQLQEVKMKRIKDDISNLQTQLAKQKEELSKQQKYLQHQLEVIDSQKKTISKQEDEMSVQRQQIAQQRQYLDNLLSQIDLKNDSIKQTQKQLAGQQLKLKDQMKQVEQSKQLYDSISAQIAQQKEVLEKQKFLIKLQQRGLLVAVIFLLLALVLVLIIYRNYRYRKRMSEILQNKNAVIQNKNEELKTQAEELKTQAEHLARANIELERLSLVASYTDNSVIIMQPDCTVEWVNNSFINFYGEDLFTEVISEKLRIDKFRNIPDLDDIIKHITEDKKSYQFIEQRKSGDKQIWIQSYITPIFNLDDTLRRLIVVDTDITPTKEAEQILSEQNKEIKQSITYASRIQGAILPQVDSIASYFSDYFIFYRPRDIVSGDFYWFGKKMNKVVFAAADCTGHGVPGAFMSMLGTSLLNSSVNLIYERYGIDFIRPEVILDRVRRLIIRLLHQKTENLLEPKDGIDLALCVYDLDKKTLSYSGANNSLYLIRNNKFSAPEVEEQYLRIIQGEQHNLYEIKPDKMPVGISRKYQEPFTAKTFDIAEGDTIYIFSDGFADQFGGPDNRKFMSKKLKELLLSNCELSMSEQAVKIEETFDYWLSFRKDEKHGGQTDDVLLWGIRF